MNAASRPARTDRLRTWRAHWKALAPRERLAVGWAATTIGLAVVWWLLLAPALQTLRQAPAQHAVLDQQLQRMQRLQAEALRLQAELPPPRSEAEGALPTAQPDLPRSLQESVNAQLGAGAQLVLQGERAQLTLRNVPAEALATWLVQARQNLKVGALEVRLTATSPAQAAAPGQHWNGSLVLALPTP